MNLNTVHRLRKAGLLLLEIPLIFTSLLIHSPVHATIQRDRKISIVYSQENANQWVGIAKRLQAAGLDYCIVPLAKVQTSSDWGERRVLLMPNIETITPMQAIALEEWMSKGGRLIATGPVGVSSSPGVRQLLNTILGGYWGFSLNGPQGLKPNKIKHTEWNLQAGLTGQVRGGAIVPSAANAQTAAVWNAKNNPAGVITTPRTTLLGWRLGANTVSTTQLDTNWLRVSVDRHLKLPSNVSTNISGGAKSCITDVASLTSTSTNIARNTPRNTTSAFPNIQATAPRNTVRTTSPPIQSDEAIDQLERSINLDVAPSSNKPITAKQARDLQLELTSLIGRVESANLATLARNNTINSSPTDTTIASANPKAITASTQQTLEQARQTVQRIPQLIRQRRYAQARQAWQQARASLWRQFPVRNQQATAEIRAVWLDRGTIVKARSEAGLAKIFDRMAQSGINTVFFETLNASYPIYPSRVAPQQNPLTRGWDPLASAVKLAKQRGMELHAWVWVFAAGNLQHNKIINVNANYPGPVLAANPDWTGYDHRGKTIPERQTKPFFDPANPQVRQYLLRLYEEIVTRYDVDGLQLDYIRYPFQDPNAGRSYGYGKAARAIFRQRYGVDPMKINPKQTNLWQKWTDFRTQQVDSFVAQVSQQLKRKRPNLKLSAAVFPLPRQERVQKIQQNWETWAQRGDIDLIVPMTYATQTYKFKRLSQPWVASIRFEKLGSTLLIPGIRLLNLPTLGTFDQLQAIRDFPVAGYALFAAENLNSSIQTLLKNTQTSRGNQNKQIIPHRQPFAAATQRYQDLYREWKLTQANNQLQIPAMFRDSFNRQAQLVEQSLNQLGEKPEPSQLTTTLAALKRFRANYQNWMRSHSLKNPYQVRSWENRLIVVEKLLRYGQRVSRL